MQMYVIHKVINKYEKSTLSKSILVGYTVMPFLKYKNAVRFLVNQEMKSDVS